LSKHSRARIACGVQAALLPPGFIWTKAKASEPSMSSKFSPVENIEDLPAELNASTLADLEVLEHGNVIVKIEGILTALRGMFPI
jgi:hypothetical protein